MAAEKHPWVLGGTTLPGGARGRGAGVDGRDRPAGVGGRRRGVLASSLAILVAALLVPAAARADLREDARRVAALWATAGGKSAVHEPLFLEQGRSRRVELRAPPGGCLSVALLAPRAAEITLAAGVSGEEAPEPSRGGLVVLSRCGPGRVALERFAVELRGSRGAVEVVSSAGDAPAPDPRLVLPERITSPPQPPLDPGRAPASESLAARMARAEGRARGEGAAEVQFSDFNAQDEGHGQRPLAVREGCHRIELLAEAGRGGRVPDVDAELRDPRSGAVLARDRSDTPDARLELCTAEPAALSLSFRGAPARARVVALQARWPLPGALPDAWGARARAAMAQALVRRGHGPPRGAPIRSFTGLAGATSIHPEIAPGACYLLLLGLARGEVRSLSITGILDGQTLRDEGGPGKDGLALSFCSQRARRLHLAVETRGGSAVWGAALWRLGSQP